MNRLITILFFFAFSSVYSQTSDAERKKPLSLNCDKFRNGTFKIPGDSSTPETTLIRKGNHQKEKMVGVDEYLEFTVKWIDDCVYTLTPTRKTYKKFPGLPAGVLTVKIIEVKENSYVQISTSSFADLKVTSEVMKIE